MSWAPLVIIKIKDFDLNYESGKISMFEIVFFCAVFDIDSHNILLERLKKWVGLSGIILKWFRTYLEGRGYNVSIGDYTFKGTSMTCRVPQGSILAPHIVQPVCTLSQIMRRNQIACHICADGTQIYLWPNDYSPIDSLCQCIDEITFVKQRQNRKSEPIPWL